MDSVLEKQEVVRMVVEKWEVKMVKVGSKATNWGEVLPGSEVETVEVEDLEVVDSVPDVEEKEVVVDLVLVKMEEEEKNLVGSD